MTIEKQLEFEELVRKIRGENPRATAPAVGEEETTIPSPLRVIQSFINSLPPFKLPPLPPFLPVLVFPTTSKPPTPLTETLEVKHPGAEEEVAAPAESGFLF